MTVYPPRKKNWKEGNYQIALFVRMPDGSTIEVSWHDAPQAVREKAKGLVLEKFPDLKTTIGKTLSG